MIIEAYHGIGIDNETGERLHIYRAKNYAVYSTDVDKDRAKVLLYEELTNSEKLTKAELIGSESMFFYDTEKFSIKGNFVEKLKINILPKLKFWV